MKNSKKLSREEMKNVLGGTNRVIWNCYWSPGVFAGTECSTPNTDPAPICDLYSCTATSTPCADTLHCI